MNVETPAPVVHFGKIRDGLRGKIKYALCQFCSF